MKRIIILIFTLVLALSSLTITVSAIDDELSMDEYAIESLTKYIIADKSLDSAYLSSSMTIYNFEDPASCKTAYFTISSDQIIGMLTVVEYNGKYYSSYVLDAPNEIKTAFSASTPFALGYVKDQLVIITQSEIASLSANQNNETISFNDISADSFEYTRLCKTGTKISSSPVQTRATMYISIHDVRRVSNDGPRCWAAAVSSIGNYHRNTNYTARTLIDACRPYDYSEEPVGTAKWYNIAYQNVLNMNISIKGAGGYGSAPLTSNEIYGNLYTYGPFQIDVSRRKTDGSTASHALVISGIIAENSESYPIQYGAHYYIVDPNSGTDSPIICNVNHDIMQDGSKFVYVPPYSPDRVYNNWFRTVIVMP